VCVITGIESNDWTAISVSDAGFSFTTTASRPAVGRIRTGRKEKEEETQIIFDVWLTVHRSSMWIKKPPRCYLVLFIT